jgi:hypothetical protein
MPALLDLVNIEGGHSTWAFSMDERIKSDVDMQENP